MASTPLRPALAEYRAQGMTELPSKEWALGLTVALQAVLQAPESERADRYRAFFEEYGGPEGLPGLPEPK